MDNFLSTYHLSKLKQEQISNLKRPITSSEIEAVIKHMLQGLSLSAECLAVGLHICSHMLQEGDTLTVAEKALIYEHKRISLGVILSVHFFLFLKTSIIWIYPRSQTHLVSGSQSSSSSRYKIHPMEWTLSQISCWLVISTSHNCHG